jgi:hypothetical protein
MRTSAGHGSTAYRPRRHFGGCFLIVMCCALQALVVSAAASADDHFFAGVREQTNPYGHLFEAPPITVPAPPVASSDDFFGQAQTPNQPPPVEHTGWATLIRSTGADFKAFPRRKSTWVILGIGAAAAGLAHPLDDDLNSHLTGSGAGKFFKLGKYLGYEYVLVGAALGTYLVGRYVVHPPEGKTTSSRTSASNCSARTSSHRHSLSGLSTRFAAIVRPASVVRSLPDMPRRRSPQRRFWSAISAIATRGRRSWSPDTSRPRACTTTNTS